ncbi:MAG: deoxyribose-phosphate aldolase [Candidatus Blackburnbacteria bacterium]|nr:deoxyribose-phosphate aldolase [Candidatus Blackburnbacteria bacterium]
MVDIDKKTLAGYLDLANHRQEATKEDIKALCRKVLSHGFHAAFVNACYITLAKDELGQGGIVGTVVSFPLGQDTKESKIAAATLCAKLGADELDVSANVGYFKAGEWEKVQDEMCAIVQAAKTQKAGVIVKFIIETGHLNDEEIKRASQAVLASGADYVKTCSGMGPRGATLKDVELVKSVVGGKIRIKVAGGVGNCEQAKAFIEAGADRIGTSHAVEIVEGIDK